MQSSENGRKRLKIYICSAWNARKLTAGSSSSLLFCFFFISHSEVNFMRLHKQRETLMVFFLFFADQTRRIISSILSLYTVGNVFRLISCFSTVKSTLERLTWLSWSIYTHIPTDLIWQDVCVQQIFSTKKIIHQIFVWRSPIRPINYWKWNNYLIFYLTNLNV